MSTRTPSVDTLPAVHVPSANALFPGDTLFAMGCGRLFEGTPEDMFQALAKLKRLPPSTRPG